MDLGRISRAASIAALLSSVPGLANATVITFDPLSGANADVYAGHTEGGFAVTPISGDWREAHIFGNPLPSIFQFGVGAGIIEITSLTTGFFTFTSAEIADANFTSDFDVTLTVEGLLGGMTVFSAIGLGPAPAGFLTVFSTDSVSVIDTLRLTLIDPTGSSSNIDNITIFAAAAPVPEPSAALLFVVGLLGLRLMRRGRS